MEKFFLSNLKKKKKNIKKKKKKKKNVCKRLSKIKKVIKS